MKKIYPYLIIFLIFLLIPIKVLAINQLVKDTNNPIEIVSEIENWNEISQRQPAIIFESNIFKIWYASYNGTHFKIVYGESPDLKVINIKKTININYDSSYDFHDPSIIKINNKYELYFAVSKNETNYKILKAVSEDGINFENSPVVIFNPDLPWNNKAVSAPFVFYENNKYYLFYTGWDGSEWKLGLSISNDGTDWVNCSNNPIIPYASGPTLIKQENKYILFFHSSNASNIESVETNDSLSCLSNWTNRQLILTRDKDYDVKLITDPNIIDKNNKLFLIYSGLNISNKWSLNLASLQPPSRNKYIILIPGFMTSWNKDSMIYNLNSSIYNWKILDFIKEYNGIISTLINANYKLDENLFIFAYDWRKSLEESSKDLKSYINNKIFSKDSNPDLFLIGHSFGGLVGRIYTQKNSEHVNKLITVGSPHKGTAQVYKAVQAGNVDSSNNFLSLAQNIVINLNRDLFKSDKEIVNTLFPSLIDIYPNYSFLYDKDNKVIDINNLKIKNNTLKKYEDINSIKDKLYSLYSDSFTALLGYKIQKQSDLNYLFENYVDGEPAESKFSSGDKNLTSLSTNIGINTTNITGDHEEIIYKKNSIKKILELLEINISESNIVEGSKTVINPSIILFIKSPAKIEVEFNNKTYKEENGLIFIENASSGIYKLKVKGIAHGKYTVLVGLFDETYNNRWISFKGIINNLDPTSQVDTYKINFNSAENAELPLIKINYLFMFTELIDKLESLKLYIEPKTIDAIIDKVHTAKKYYINKNLSKLDDIYLAIYKVITGLGYTQNTNINNKTLDILNLLEQIYKKTLNKEMKITKTALIKKKENIKNIKKSFKDLFDQAYNTKKEIIPQLDSIHVEGKKLKKEIVAIKNDNLAKAKQIFVGVKKLFKNISKQIRR